MLKVKLLVFLQGIPSSVPNPGLEGEISNFCSCPSQCQADPPAADHAADDSCGCQRAAKRMEKPALKGWGTPPDENCNLLGYLRCCWDSCLLRSQDLGNIFGFPLQSLMLALSDESETSVLLLRFTSELEVLHFWQSTKVPTLLHPPTYVCCCKLKP